MKRRKGYRLIDINGTKWQWCFGQSVVVAVSEHGETRKIGLCELTGMDWYNIERAVHKRGFVVSPKHIKRWLA